MNYEDNKIVLELIEELKKYFSVNTVAVRISITSSEIQIKEILKTKESLNKRCISMRNIHNDFIN